ncbi:divergent polysaccharide deacetylase family protein [Sporomusa termitida]|uniref:Divergent polysaccharide deacetylase n=1 Tax=Sporomusa termitida TaxID=2377 RepID=A0A517DVW5_9FIRM|nr:divergent polysaccharide deacetylase family protein [Sporomusa termitida]QDR81416.1 Divergent polysaccharide deacetylase [Sporomusa termitida]
MAKKSNHLKWILALAALVIAVIFYQAGSPPAGYDLEKTGAGVVLDFTDTANKIHAAVDAGLNSVKVKPERLTEARQEVPRTGVEGLIRWHSRSMLVMVPATMSPAVVEQALTPAAANAGGQVIGTEPDTYNGAPTVRIDVGIKDMLNNEPLTIVTDRIYVAQEQSPVPQIKPKPEVKSGGGEMAIIIDDFGYIREPIAEYANMGRPITFAVLPYRQYSTEAASAALSAGHLVMLHLPLEPLSATEETEPTVITVNMPAAEIKQTVEQAIASIPGLKGVNNHQGSKATADRQVMKTVLGVIKAHNLFFIDSRTSNKTVAAEVSRQLGLRTGENELFLDNSSDIELIKKQLRTAIAMARRNGSVTVIGHARPNTVIAVREMIPEIEAAGIRLVYADQLIR